jgi:hypothetical protein
MKRLFGLTAILAIFLLAGCDSTQASAPNTLQITPTATLSPTSTPTPKPELTKAPMQQSVQQQPVPTKAPMQQSVQQQPVPTKAPAQQPAPPAPAKLFVSFTSATAVDNSSGSVSVNTLPSAALTISVKYCSGSYADSSSLKGTKYADSSGNYTWSWIPDTKCKGTATAYVTASLNGQSASGSKDFTVS